MHHRSRLTLLAGVASLAGALLAGCTPPPPSPQARADAARVAACRGRVDEIYARQHRAEIYTDTSSQQSLTPFSGGYVSGITTRGLPDRFQRDEEQADCLRDAGGGPAPQ